MIYWTYLSNGFILCIYGEGSDPTSYCTFDRNGQLVDSNDGGDCPNSAIPTTCVVEGSKLGFNPPSPAPSPSPSPSVCYEAFCPASVRGVACSYYDDLGGDIRICQYINPNGVSPKCAFQRGFFLGPNYLPHSEVQSADCPAVGSLQSSLVAVCGSAGLHRRRIQEGVRHFVHNHLHLYRIADDDTVSVSDRL